MNSHDKWALWAFGILLISGVNDISLIIEFGSAQAWVDHILSLNILTKFIVMLRIIIEVIASIYLTFVYPLFYLSKGVDKK